MSRRLAAAAAAFVVSALFASNPANAQVRTINVPPSEYPAGVGPGEDGLRVQVRYELAADGSFARCEVRRSSGHAAVDAASCRLLTERARFRPEPGTGRGRLNLRWLGSGATRLNPPGAPIAVSLHDEISDRDYPASAIDRDESGTVEYAVEVSESGVPLRCSIAQSSGSEALDRRSCDIVMERSAFIPASNGAGGRARSVYRGRIAWRIGG